ncbi:hypothetical protein N2152v2_010273 [Parachlorella kessleri]
MSGLAANLAFGPPSKKSPVQHSKNAKPRQQVDAESWRQEYERVKHLLVITGSADAGSSKQGEWRSDLERARASLQAVSSTTAEARVALEDVGQGLATKLQQLGRVEAAANRELQGSREASSELERQLTVLRQEHDSKKEYVAELQKELVFLNGVTTVAGDLEEQAAAVLTLPAKSITADPLKEMEERRRQLEEQGDSLSSAKPVAHLRAAVEALRAELGQMDVRVGVLQHLVARTL